MAITNSNIYQDLIMNPSYMPNRLQNLEMFPPVDTGMNVFSSGMYDDPNIPGYNFIDAPTSFINRIQNPQFLNNPRTGFIDNPDVNLLTQARDAVSTGLGKGIDLGKTAIGGILSLVSGIPGIGMLANMLPERDYRQTALEDFYGNIQNGTIQSGLMAGYNPVSGGLLNMLTGGRYGDPTNYGLQRSYQKRIDMIRKNLAVNKYKDPDAMRERLEQLEELKRKEAEALQAERDKAAAELESKRIGRRPSAPSGGGVRDDQADRSSGQTGGYSYDSGGRQGFGYGLKNGGLAGLL